MNDQKAGKLPILRCAMAALLLCMPAGAVIRRISIVHLSHTDVGFTDHPAVTRELQREYLSLALDAAIARPDFRWTAESLMSVDDWWKQAPPARRAQFTAAVRRGQIAVAALPFNNTPFLSAAQWGRMLHWLPAELWTQLRPLVAVQNDVNGFPRAGALALLDRGVGRLFMGLNSDQGGPPFPRPTAFWWKMPDGRRMMVYLGDSYPAGYSYFHESDWRRGPVPSAADTAFRRPRAGDFFRSDDAALAKAHSILLRKLQRLEANPGYRWETLIIPFSNQWRMDNDPPYPAVAEFVAAWNRKGLKPELRLDTAAAALAEFEREAGATLPEHSGEWTDWWANGTGSAPRAVAASREAKRHLEELHSPLFVRDPAAASAADELTRDLCLFDEHTWGSSLSVAKPDSLDSQAQWIEKSRLAYRPLAVSRYLVANAARAKVASMPEAMYVLNTAPLPYTGWVTVPLLAFRQKDPPKPGHTVAGMEPWVWPKDESEVTAENDARLFRDTRPALGRFWASNLAPHSVTELRSGSQQEPAPDVRTDEKGWPVSVHWPQTEASFASVGFGDFFSVAPGGALPRLTMRDLAGGKPGEVLEVHATNGQAVREETPHTVIFRQSFSHPSLRRGLRVLEVWKGTPRMQIRYSLYRRSSEAVESFYASFPLPVHGAAATLSSGGMTFTPYTDQLPGTCRDYFAIDGWIHYAGAQGDWLWVSRDAPLVSFERIDLWARRKDPRATDRILANLFNNLWYTNFVGNENGAFEYQFDLQWAPRIPDPAALARTLLTEPWVVAR